MTYRSYACYRHCKLEWIGELPEGWKVSRLKHLFALMRRPPRDEDETVTAFRDGTVTLRSRRRLDGFTNSLQEIGYQGVRKGDLVIHAMDAFAGAIGVSEDDGKSTPVYSVCIPADADISSYYYALLLRHLALSGFINALAKGIRERSTEFRWSEASNVSLPVPSYSEQQAIVAFLDRETAKIDALMEEQKRLIGLLKEKRQAVISHAVTKGLNPDAPMKDSGIEWLGEVPEHWEVVPLMRLTEPGRNIMYGIVLPGPNVEEGVPIVKGGDVRPQRLRLELLNRTTSEIELPFARARLRPNDIVYSIRGTIGDAELVPGELLDANITQDVARVSPRAGVHNAWLLWALKSHAVFSQLDRLSAGAAVRGVNIFDLKRARVPVPPKEEQERLAQHLSRAIGDLDALVQEATLSIDLLVERRAALISACVTGKIDVRSVALTRDAAE